MTPLGFLWLRPCFSLYFFSNISRDFTKGDYMESYIHNPKSKSIACNKLVQGLISTQLKCPNELHISRDIAPITTKGSQPKYVISPRLYKNKQKMSVKLPRFSVTSSQQRHTINI